MASGDLTTVDKVRSYLKLRDLEDDDYIAQCVATSSAWVKSECGRDFLIQDYNETYDGDGSFSIRLRQYPVVSVTSVTLNGEVLPQRINITDGGWVLNNDRVELQGGYRFASYAPYPGAVIGFLGYAPGNRAQNVVIAYRAGYATIPADLEQAVILHAALSYWDRERFGKTSVSSGGESVNFNGGIVTSTIEDILDRYRRLF